MTDRRERGTGSVYYDQGRERWVGVVTLGTRADGRRVTRKVTAATKADAVKRLRDLRAEVGRGGPSAHQAMTVGELLDGWAKKEVPIRVANVNTVENYKRAADLARTELGSVRVARLTPDHVERLYGRLAKDGYSRATIVRVRSVVGQALTWGVRRRYASWNPVAVAALPPDSEITGRTHDGRSFTEDEARAFIAAAADARNGAGLVLALTCGLRPGEWTALAWDDLDGDVLHVRRAWKDTDENRRLGEPKTRKSVRSVQIPAAVVVMLHEHRRTQLGEAVALGWRNADDLMFVSEVGTALDPANVRRLVRAVAKTAKLNWTVTPYTLRHSAASLLVDQGVTIERVADLLGHASTQVTERYYTHRVRASVDAAVGPMDALLAAQ